MKKKEINNLKSSNVKVREIGSLRCRKELKIKIINESKFEKKNNYYTFLILFIISFKKKEINSINS